MTSSVILLPLLQRLGSLQMDQTNFLLLAKPEVDSLREQLQQMIAYLMSEESIYPESQLVKGGVRDFRGLVFEAEDAFDLFVYEVALRQQENVVMKIVTFPKFLHTTLKQIGKIREITRRIQQLSFIMKRYLTLYSPVSQTRAEQVYRGSHGVDDVVGLQSEVDELAKLLMKEDHNVSFGVVSITGMGGLGKTTLAKKVYDRVDVKRHFDCQAWICLSKEYRMENVLCDIIKQVELLTFAEKNMLASMKVESLKERLSECLKKKNYLFVIDDIWGEKDWDKLKASFPVPCKRQKFRVLLTTRDDRVARYDLIAPPHKLKCLDENRSLELFFKVVFQGSNYSNAVASLNEMMNGIAKKIVAKCSGLPLAIVVLGRGLSYETQSIFSWDFVFRTVDLYLDKGDCLKVLALSFTELSNHLKACFLYFGLFPKGCIIQRDRLIRLWVAEGFLEPRENLRMEDVARDCLQELTHMHMIEVAKWKSNGVPESFVIHDLLWELANSEGNEGNFLNILTPEVSLESLECSRRVALHSGNYIEYTMGSNSPRSFISFTEISQLSLCVQFKLLNVLDLECASGIETLPDEMGKLILLKYLNLSRTNLKSLPPWIGNLYNLQTLNLYKTLVAFVPTEILKLIKLRHLLCCNKKIRYKLHVGQDNSWMPDDFIAKSDRLIDQLRDLQTLWFHTGVWMKDGLEMLTNLRELGLTGIKGLMRNFEDVLFQALLKLKLLEVLYLEEQDECEIILPPFSGHRYLYDVTIIGVIGKLPQLNEFPPNLTRLRLSCHHLKEDMMETLEKLPELKELKLDWQPYDGIIMKCSTGGFPKLQYLNLICFDWLCYWIVEEEAMPNLKILDINRVYGLKWIPGGLKHITTLEKLSMTMPKEFLQRVKEGGKDWEKIKHIPSINTREEETPKVISRHLPAKVSEWFQSTGQGIPEDQ